MRTCPYCGSPIPNQESLCPACGAAYWEPGADSAGPEPGRPPEEAVGCLSTLLIPLLIALGGAALLLAAGFVLHMLAHFESYTFRLVWIAGSLSAGIGLYRYVRRRIASPDRTPDKTKRRMP